MSKKRNIKKDITFIYSDTAEKQIMKPIIKEAEKRGYTTRLTDNNFAKCEIGFYCQHINFPQYSKFSLIMLHDITQQYGNWPDVWFSEPWNKYDIGILPGKVWEKNWNQCSKFYYARPRKGMYLVGWPKADFIAELGSEEYKENFFKKYGLDKNKKTVLYAPAWENDGKEDEFVQAALKCNVNILIKQAPLFREDNYPVIYNNIQEQRKLHENMPGVTWIDPEVNIFDVIAVSDILVSEESSTMCESVLMGKPAISVSDWLIPDVTPSRYPCDTYDYVIETKKAELSDCINKVLANYSKYAEDAKNYTKANYSNIGTSSVMIMDIIDHYVEEKELTFNALNPQNNEKIPFKKKLLFNKKCFMRELTSNYALRNPFLHLLYSCYRILKGKKPIPRIK